MKNRKYFLFLGILLTLTLCFFKNKNFSVRANEENINNVENNIKDISNFATNIRENKKLLENDTLVATINGEPVYKGELEFRKKLYELDGKLKDKDDYKTPFN